MAWDDPSAPWIDEDPATPLTAARFDASLESLADYTDSETFRAQVAEALKLAKANNLSDVADAGSSRFNIHIPALAVAKAVSTTNIAALTGHPTIDGVAVTEGMVLLVGQTTASENGPWIVPSVSGVWTRPTDFPHAAVITGQRTIAVAKGTVNAHTEWLLSTAPTTVDTSAQTWELILPSSVINSLFIEIIKTVATAGEAQTINLSEANAYRFGLNKPTCTLTVPSPAGKAPFFIDTEQDATGGRKLVYPASCRFSGGVEPILSTAPGARDRVVFEPDTDGEHWIVSLGQYGLGPTGGKETVPLAVQAVSPSGALSKLWIPEGYKEENTPRAVEGNTDFTLVSGQAHLFSGPTLRAGQSYTRVALQMGAIAASVPTHSFILLCNQNREILKMGKDKGSGAIGSFRYLEFELESALVPAAETQTYMTVVSVATTPFSLRGQADATLVYAQPYECGKSPNWVGITTPASLLEKGACGVLEAPAAVVIPHCLIG